MDDSSSALEKGSLSAARLDYLKLEAGNYREEDEAALVTPCCRVVRYGALYNPSTTSTGAVVLSKQVFSASEWVVVRGV